jgi:hypothetical protein
MQKFEKKAKRALAFVQHLQGDELGFGGFRNWTGLELLESILLSRSCQNLRIKPYS